MKRSTPILILLGSFLLLTKGQLVWTTTSDVQADSKKLITNLTNSGTNPIPTATMVFNFAFPSIPRATYGITAYRGTILFI